MEGSGRSGPLDASAAAIDSQMRTLAAAQDRFGGVVIDSESLPDDASVFVDCLKNSLLQWRAQVTLVASQSGSDRRKIDLHWMLDIHLQIVVAPLLTICMVTLFLIA
jgi:hypothetical protein